MFSPGDLGDIEQLYRAFLQRQCDEGEIEKEKLSSIGDGESCGDGGGGGGSGGAGGVSASLTPTIWDKTIPYDGENFHLEYMDLDEFLLENQIPAALEEELHKSLEQEAQGSPAAPEVSAAVPQAPRETEKAAEVPKIKGEDEGGESEIAEQQVMENATEPKDKPERATPSPVNPEEIEVSINFQPDPADLVLSSIPGGELFNPRKHRFTEDELKPQPMIKKARKVFVPEDAKDEKYWSRRKKNNLAAKRSRDARCLKENQIAVRASFLERENAALRQEVAELRKNCSRCKKIVALYEAKYGPL
ncbi:TEF transcription factor, PAR bZIP family member b isoform X2 [Pangasianodon hypophthalmus]|uniref:TEF transcription factor, PAR bZIP family member b isoform X2 n=1 Tax=Pangasianodon hypophthalmus TaxID=310915 RepID=UPI0023078E9D|nr:TEF transcription factor, PAR bZIP family member b isoform X2 [Pangasianodon hypophthalmus]